MSAPPETSLHTDQRDWDHFWCAARALWDYRWGQWNQHFGDFVNGDGWFKAIGPFDWSALTAVLSLTATLVLLYLTRSTLAANKSMAAEARRSSEAALASARATATAAHAAEVSAAAAESAVDLTFEMHYQVGRRRIRPALALPAWPPDGLEQQPYPFMIDWGYFSAIPESFARRYLWKQPDGPHMLFYGLTGRFGVKGAKVWIHQITLVDYGPQGDWNVVEIGESYRHRSHPRAYDVPLGSGPVPLQPGESRAVSCVYRRSPELRVRRWGLAGEGNEYVLDVTQGLNPKDDELRAQVTYSLTPAGERRSAAVHMVRPKDVWRSAATLLSQSELTHRVLETAQGLPDDEDPSCQP